MSEVDNPHDAAIRWDCPYCFVRAGERCHVKWDATRETPYLHSRRGAVLRKILRDEFYRGVAYERSSQELRALRRAQQSATMAREAS